MVQVRRPRAVGLNVAVTDLPAPTLMFVLGLRVTVPLPPLHEPTTRSTRSPEGLVSVPVALPLPFTATGPTASGSGFMAIAAPATRVTNRIEKNAASSTQRLMVIATPAARFGDPLSATSRVFSIVHAGLVLG